MRALALFALLLAAALLGAGCGGDETSMTAEEAERPGPSEAAEPARGGEASIEDFGEEASGAERSAITGAFDSYLTALAERDYAEACQHLSAQAQSSLEQFSSGSGKAQGCAAILPGLLAPTAATIAREQANGEIARVRVEGETAFVVFHAPGAELYEMTMLREGGEWKAATVAASVLVPDL